ncbi:hypothetical protein H9185_001188 [Listeria monocytogenes]|nr:hypothetical protein [Listeria monocytogenes]
MTKKGALQILAILKAAYPSSYNGMTKEEATGTVAVWCMQFAELPEEVVLMAVHKLIATNKFPPSISEVKNKIEKIHWEAYEALTNDHRNPFLTEEAKKRFQQIYDVTRDYKYAKYAEPPISRMLLGNDGQPLQIGSGG